MKRIRQGWNTLRRSRRSGVSLIVALCAVAVLIGLSLSIVYSSSMLLSRANRKIGRERCYQLAQSFAQVLDSELQEYKTIKPELDINFAPEGCFYREVNNILAEDTGLGIYDPDRSDETTACYNAGSTEDNYGRITILLRDVTDVQDPITGDTFAYGARDEGTERQSRQPLTDIRFGWASRRKRERTATCTPQNTAERTVFSQSTHGKGKTASADSSRSTG